MIDMMEARQATLDELGPYKAHSIDQVKDRLAQVLINLISNAVKYGAHKTPRIDIRLTERPQGTTHTVTDNGPGIPPGDAEREFEKFSRLSATTLAGSAGLGLPSSREIMRALGGELTLQPSKQGASFVISLPREEVQQTAAQ